MDTATLRARAKAAWTAKRAAKLPRVSEPTAILSVGVRRLYARGAGLADIPTGVRGLPWHIWKSMYLNSLFLSFGTLKEPAKIRPETVKQGEEKWKS